MNIPMAPNAFDLAVLISSNPVMKNGCVCNNIPTNSCKVEMERDNHLVRPTNVKMTNKTIIPPNARSQCAATLKEQTSPLHISAFRLTLCIDHATYCENNSCK